MKTDVLIVAAPLTGQARQSIRRAVDFVVPEKKETTPFSKANGLPARARNLEQRIGLAGQMSALGAKI